MNQTQLLSPWIKRFLLEYLITIRNFSRNTQQSYRDTIRLLLSFIAAQSNRSIEKLNVTNLSRKQIESFLLELEEQRGCSLSTRNQRLAAIHSLAHFIAINSPEHLEWCQQIRSIPFKKTRHSLITYLEKKEMDALLNAPDRSTNQGRRDYTLLLFLYNTGARSTEVAQLKIADLTLSPKSDFSSVLIRGKGNKLRRCPLWAQTVEELNHLISERSSLDHVFLNRCKNPITRFGIYALVKRYTQQIITEFPELVNKVVSPHTIRHTTATHLLRSGVDINTIRAWLGHVSVNTTNIYAEVDLEMKAKALLHCEVKDNNGGKIWKKNEGIMAFLNSL